METGAPESGRIAAKRPVRTDEYDKENIGDFALWKAWDEADGEVGWIRPGPWPAGVAH